MESKVSNVGGICPFCGRVIDNWGDWEWENGEIVIEFECECGATGSECYTTTFKDLMAEK